MAEPADYWLLSGRQSPFTWRSPVMSEERSECALDKACLHGTTWMLVMDKIRLGYSFFRNGDRRRGRALIAECYIPMLPTFSPGCDIVNDYREVLLHVLDTCWASMVLAEPSKTDAEKALLDQFILRIPSAFGFTAKQRAAVHLIRALCDGNSGLIAEAVRLSPDEGEWKLHAGWELEQERGPTPVAPPPSRRELELLRDAFRLRPSPETISRLARSLVSDGQRGREEARRLFEEAAVRWPDNPRVLYQTALDYTVIHGCTRKNTRKQIRLFERVLEVAGECAYIHSKLSVAYRVVGRHGEAERHLARALEFIPGKCVMGQVMRSFKGAVTDDDAEMFERWRAVQLK